MGAAVEAHGTSHQTRQRHTLPHPPSCAVRTLAVAATLALCTALYAGHGPMSRSQHRRDDGVVLTAGRGRVHHAFVTAGASAAALTTVVWHAARTPFAPMGVDAVRSRNKRKSKGKGKAKGAGKASAVGKGNRKRRRRGAAESPDSDAEALSAIEDVEVDPQAASPTIHLPTDGDVANAPPMDTNDWSGGIGDADPLQGQLPDVPLHYSGVPDYVYRARGAGIREANGFYTPVAVMGGALAYVNKNGILLHRTTIKGRPGWILVRDFTGDDPDPLYGTPSESPTPVVGKAYAGGWIPGTDTGLPTLERVEGNAANSAFMSEPARRARKKWAKARMAAHDAIPREKRRDEALRWRRQPPPVGHRLEDLMAASGGTDDDAGADSSSSERNERLLADHHSASETASLGGNPSDTVSAADIDALARFSDAQLLAELARRLKGPSAAAPQGTEAHDDGKAVLNDKTLRTASTSGAATEGASRSDLTGDGTSSFNDPQAAQAAPRRAVRPPPLLHTVPVLPVAELPELDAGPVLPESTVKSFRRDGHVTVHNLLSDDEVGAYRPHVHLGMIRTGTLASGVEAEHKDFARVHNLWRLDAAMRQLVLSPRLASVAAQLLNVSRVRLYQDSAFMKEAGDHGSSWHIDAVAAPVHSDLFVTAWIPLVDVARAMGPLRFGTGTHKQRELGFVINLDDDEVEAAHNLTEPAALLAGDATFHLSSTLHGSNPNKGAWSREAFTAAYFADGARTYAEEGDLHSLTHDDAAGLRHWPPLGPSALLDGPFVPLAGGM